MRPRRYLLITTALSAAASLYGCKKEDAGTQLGHEPVHGNPKGMSYQPDAGPNPAPPADLDAGKKP